MPDADAVHEPHGRSPRAEGDAMKPGDRVVVLVPERDEPGVASPPSFAPSRRLRVRAWRRRAALTRELAAGRRPDARPELALVARRLVGTPARRSLADALDRVVREAAERPQWGSNRVPLNRAGILAARGDLAALADGLRAAAPAPLHAVALATVLVTDGTSPLYDRRAVPGVAHIAETARRALDDPIDQPPAVHATEDELNPAWRRSRR